MINNLDFIDRTNLKFIEIETNGENIINFIETYNVYKIYYINNFIKNNNFNLLNFNNFLDKIKKYSDKISIIREYSNIALKNPFITIQQFDYIHFNQTENNDLLLKNIILSFDLLKNNGYLHISIINKELFKNILFSFLFCYSNYFNIITDNEIDFIIKKIN